MEQLKFSKCGINLLFSITDTRRLIFHGMGTSAKPEILEENPFFTPVELHTTGANPDDHHGAKHTGSDCLYYKEHQETEDMLCFVLENDAVSVQLIYEFFRDTKTIRVHTEIQNISKDCVGIEYLSSFCLYGINPEKIYLPHNSWCRELNWKIYTPQQLGYTKTTEFSTKRICVSNTGTWSSKEYLPMGMIEEPDRMLFWQIEHNGSWNWEISDITNKIYLKLSGPSEQENGWWKNLQPGESFTSVSVAIALGTDFSDAVKEMTNYRRTLAYRSKTDASLPVIFNDYMGCLWADPTTETLLPVIQAAADAGAEIYCMDAGWYADGTWWETVGEWQVCEKRFSNGMKEIFDFIRKKGMIGGIWLEPESIGIQCPILDQFDDSCFFMRHGKRVIDHGRYHLDFRSKKVTDFLDGVVDRLIADFGIGYFKFDYNIDGGVGTELDADSFGDGLMQHNAAFLKWIDGIYQRHPNLILEGCASGGMRMDYKTLSRFSLQSLTDATHAKQIAPISAMSQTAVIPEQAAVWVIPQKKDSLGEVAMNMVNAMFKRMHLSGSIPWMNQEQLAVVKEGVGFYKSIRERILCMTAFYPIGICDAESDWTVVGYTDGQDTYLCVVRLGGEDTLTLTLPNHISYAERIYPHSADAYADLNQNQITLRLPVKSGAVFQIK